MPTVEVQTEEIRQRVRDLIAAVGASTESEFLEAVQRLLEWTPEFTNRDVFNEKNPYYDKGDEDAPFFSEAYLYNLLGKEDARTLLAWMRPIWRLAGLKREDQP
jgi:hypothetical protein